jgi:hypothetical protein
MFYSTELLCSKGALGQIWVRARAHASLEIGLVGMVSFRERQSE